MNNFNVIGRLGRDPETRSTSGGKSVTSFSIAVDVGWGERKTTFWLNVSAWNKTGETAQNYLKKGSKVALSGPLNVRQYESNGETKTSVEITANELTLLDPKPNSEAAPSRPAARTRAEYSDEDVPF